MDNKEKLIKFIEDNKIDFTRGNGVFNANCVTVCGFACYLEFDSHYVFQEIWVKESWTNESIYELERIFNYVYNNNYGDWWNHPEAKKMYKF